MRYLACDIGASSGRHILGTLENGHMEIMELYRFDNEYALKDGHLCWDVEALKRHVLQGLKAARPYAPVSFGIDTWGVDFVLLDQGERIIGGAVAYRDRRTEGMDARLEERLPFARHYSLTGIAKQPFNTVYQLMSLPREALEKAESFLMMPDYLHFFLTGKKCNEYTNASTTAMLNAKTRAWDPEVLQAAGLPPRLFANPPVMPGTILGDFLPEIAREAGYWCKVVLPATHDTGSAFLAVPAKDENALYLSSGTWSLLGVELKQPLTDGASLAAGFTNEGGYGGKYSYLQNIMGMWILQQIRKEQGKRHSFGEMAEMAQAHEGFAGCFNANDPRFMAPRSMIREIESALGEGRQPLPGTDGELYACVYHSLARCYREAAERLQGLTGKAYTSMNIVGGGSQNRVLNQWTANALGIPVYAGPAEGTALGNLAAQMIAAGEFPDGEAARRAIARSFPMDTYLPGTKGA